MFRAARAGSSSAVLQQSLPHIPPSSIVTKPSRSPCSSSSSFSTSTCSFKDGTQRPVPLEFAFRTSHVSEAKDQKKEAAPTLTIPLLNKPIGVPTKPTDKPPTHSNSEQIKHYLKQGRMDERRRIIKESAKGYWSDFHEFRREQNRNPETGGGKAWMAPTRLIRADRALYFPRVEGTSVKDRATRNTAEMLDGKVSIVCILNTGISVEHNKSFFEPVVDAFTQNPDFQLVQLNLQPNLMKHYLLSLFLSSVRSQVPEPHQATYLLSKLDLDSPQSGIDSIHREDLNVHNIYAGYTYLVDRDSKIRWAGCGFAQPAERESLVRLTGNLLDSRTAKSQGQQ